MNTIKAPNSDENLLATLRALVIELCGPRVSINDELWTSEDIAQYLKLAQYTVERRVVVQPGFPAAFQPCATGSKAVKRWFAGEVITWARQNRAKLPTARSSRKAA